MRAFRAEAPAWCLKRAVEAAKRQPVPLEMEDDVVAPQAAYELMTSFKDSHHGVGLRSRPSLEEQASGAPRSLGTGWPHFAMPSSLAAATGMSEGVFSACREFFRILGSRMRARTPFSGAVEVASSVPCGSTMMTTSSSRAMTLLRWAFQKHYRTITCCIDMVDDGSAFDVCVLPHWDLYASTIERFDDAAKAFEHHAEIALMLRQAGSATAQHSPRHAIAAA